MSISNTGVGLPRAADGQIFNAVFTTELHATGMGLSLSRSVVATIGGLSLAVDNGFEVNHPCPRPDFLDGEKYLVHHFAIKARLPPNHVVIACRLSN